jgi:hypothetical protein
MAQNEVATLSDLFSKHEAQVACGLDAQPARCWVATVGADQGSR